MPSFDLDADLSDDRAYELLKNSPVTLFRRPEILDQVLGWLTEHNYRLIRLDASRWAAEADFHRDIQATLDFPDYYGQNLNAFNDCLRERHYSPGGRRAGDVESVGGDVGEPAIAPHLRSPYERAESEIGPGPTPFRAGG